MMRTKILLIMTKMIMKMSIKVIAVIERILGFNICRHEGKGKCLILYVGSTILQINLGCRIITDQHGFGTVILNVQIFVAQDFEITFDLNHYLLHFV